MSKVSSKCLSMKKQQRLKEKEDKDDYPSKIEKGLFLGSVKAAKNIGALRDLNITHILTVANGVQPHAHPTDDYKYKRIEVADKTDADLTQHFTECFDFIDEARRTKEDGSRGGGGVLVHCVAGMSRSVSIVVAYLIKTNRVSFSQAMEYVQSKRSQANPNDGFRQQLKDFEKSLSLQVNDKYVKKAAAAAAAHQKNKKKM